MQKNTYISIVLTAVAWSGVWFAGNVVTYLDINTGINFFVLGYLLPTLLFAVSFFFAYKSAVDVASNTEKKKYFGFLTNDVKSTPAVVLMLLDIISVITLVYVWIMAGK